MSFDCISKQYLSNTNLPKVSYFYEKLKQHFAPPSYLKQQQQKQNSPQ